MLALNGVGGVIVAQAPRANGACLPGDLSPQCIGVYKVPISDGFMKSMVSTKEALKQFAPDLNFVPPIPAPKSSLDAWEILQAQRRAADDISSVVAAGRLEEAGIKVLNLLPRLTDAGRVLVDAAESAMDTNNRDDSTVIRDLRRQQLLNSFEMTEFAWRDVDLLLGQGLRGDLGVSAAAQLLILSELREANAALDDFLFVIDRLKSQPP